MPVMGFKKFERLFRAAAEVRVDRDDIKSYLDFVDDVLYDLLISAQASAKADGRDIIAPSDLPVAKGLQERVHEFQRLDEEIELRPVLDQLAARPPLDVGLSEEAEVRLPLLYGGVTVALAKIFKIVDEEVTAVHRREWERAFRLFRLLI